MGVEIYSNGGSTSFCGGYGGFMCLRENIAKAFDAEFGEHYSKLVYCRSKEDCESFDKTANEILSDERFNDEDEDIIEFLFANDCEGSISHKTCKKIYDLIKDIDFKGEIFTYGAHSDGKDYEHFKAFLLECYSNRRKMRWN